ncbi:MAG: hypothetical protein A2283_03680 [Lentisphaerae bacterium RIFOXYA12_FULL_48_11]|nr:MAG: hypothetical protein A2283_03680 [Lentisphaerae bacterium RIFOXYA12_FULL_48_11]
MRYERDRLSITLPVRMSPTIYKLLENQSWEERKSSAEIVRECVVAGLKRRGITIPERMDCWTALELKAEQIKAEQAKIDTSLFPPLE